MELKEISARKILDVIGKTCPYPVLEAGATLRKMKDGEILEVLTDYEPSVRTGLPSFCKRHECKYNSIEENSDGKVYWKFYIEKSDRL